MKAKSGFGIKQVADSFVICGSQSDPKAEIRVMKQPEVPND